MRIDKPGFGGLSFKSLSVETDRVIRNKAWLSVYNLHPLCNASMLENDRYEILKRIAEVLFKEEILNTPKGEEFIIELNLSRNSTKR